MEAGKEASIHQTKANKYKEFQDVLQVKPTMQWASEVSTLRASEGFNEGFLVRVSNEYLYRAMVRGKGLRQGLGFQQTSTAKRRGF